MAYAKMVELSTAEGSVFIDPRKVTHVRPLGHQTQLHLTSSYVIAVDGSSDQVAQSLWDFKNEADGKVFFNDEHVIAIRPSGDGSVIMFSDGASLHMPVSTKDMKFGFDVANQQRDKLRQ